MAGTDKTGRARVIANPRENAIAAFKEMPGAIATGARTGLESIPGFAGDLGEMSDLAVGYGAGKLGFDPEKAIRGSHYLNPLPHMMPTSEDVGAGTDWAVNQLPSSLADPIQAATRHQSVDPGNQLLENLVAIGMDPDTLGMSAGVRKLAGRDDLMRLMLQGAR